MDIKGKIPPIQTKAPEIPALQTLLNEEKGRKRDREESTPVSGPVVAQVEIEKARNLLGHMPQQTNRLIHFLNTKTSEELATLDIRDRTGTILTIKRVMTMITLMQNLERKSQDMQVEVNSFVERFVFLHEMGLLSLLGRNERLLRQIEYAHKLNKHVVDQVNASSSTPEEKALPSGQTLYNNLENLFYIEHEVKHLFAF